VDLLRRLGVTLGYSVNSIPSVTAGGEVISSSLIRQNIRNGDLGRVKELLGRHYSICGVVEKGDQLGRNLGFPTANLGVEGLELPPCGVYSATVLLGTQQVRAVLNLGYRPTLNVPTPLLRFEVHILDFDGDLYGREIEVFPEQKLRDELRFPSVGALKEQISRDIAHARTLVSSTRPADLEARSGLQTTGTITTR
jgi:riboflavin kinase/FMN adenylyltransferase